jgi:DNA-binding MarR family transcriptional regulator
MRRPPLLPVLVLLAFAALVLLALPTASAGEGISMDVGTGQYQLFVSVDSAFDLARSGRPIPMQVDVWDVNGVPQPGVPVLLTATAGRVVPERVVTDGAGHATFTFAADVDGTTTVQVIARTGLDGAAQGIAAFRVRVVHLPPPPVYARAEVVSLGVLSGLLVLASATEVGRHGFLGLAFPLYTRLKKEKVLDHFVRGQIYGAIQMEPGTTFTAIRRLLDLSNGTLSYHLKTLEVTGFVRSERDGTRKRFFPADVRPSPDGEGIRLSDLQRFLLARLKRNPEAVQRDLAREAGVTQQCISYNLRILRRQGLIAPIPQGRRTRYQVLAT